MRTPLTRRTSAIALAGVLALAGAACGDDAEDTGTDVTNEVETEMEDTGSEMETEMSEMESEVDTEMSEMDSEMDAEMGSETETSG